MSNDVWQRIEQARGRWNVLEHPFYQRWSAGELTGEELARYSGQYRHATAAIARLSAAVAESAPEAERPELRRHAAEEADHVDLWDGFVDAVGGTPAPRPRPRQKECVHAWTAVRRPACPACAAAAIGRGLPAELTDEARGPHRPLWDRRPPRHRVLPPSTRRPASSTRPTAAR